MQPLSFSTSWNRKKNRDGEIIAREILALGFERIELGHGLDAPLVADLLQAQQKLGFSVSSLHCYCPAPPEIPAGGPDCYRITSQKPAESKRAVQLAVQTIEMARRFQAPCVVFHAGSVALPSITPQLLDFVAHGQILGKEYSRVKLDAVSARARVSPRYVSRVAAALAPLIEIAEKAGVKIGIENRQDWEDFPNEEEILALLDILESPAIGYWHDFGHAQIRENLGFLDHAQWLESIAHRTIGCHIHDTAWPHKDHLAPFTGDTEFPKILSKLPSDIERVFELRPSVEIPDIIAARTRLTNL